MERCALPNRHPREQEDLGNHCCAWVGLIITWILARRCLPNQTRRVARKQILTGFAIVFCATFLAGAAGFLYGTLRGPKADYSDWQSILRSRGVTDVFAFMRVGYVHNASYAGGAIGSMLTFVLIQPSRAKAGR